VILIVSLLLIYATGNWVLICVFCEKFYHFNDASRSCTSSGITVSYVIPELITATTETCSKTSQANLSSWRDLCIVLPWRFESRLKFVCYEYISLKFESWLLIIPLSCLQTHNSCTYSSLCDIISWELRLSCKNAIT